MQDDDTNLSAQLAKWARSHGAKINGVAAHKFPGKGIGIIAERKLEAGETILEIPTSLIKTEQSLPKCVRTAVEAGACSVNGLLALELALDTSKSHTLWRSTLPSSRDVQSSMPLFWPPHLQSLLPPASSTLLRKQQSKLSRDWSAISVKFPKLMEEQYTYDWLLVSTRTFYYTPPNLPADEVPEADECLAIVPFGDYFNHHSSSSPSSSSPATTSATAPSATCKVTYSPTAYEFTVPATSIPKDTELFISYGSHSNDFLLVEYGFILPLCQNPNDTVALDEVILPLFSAERQKLLEGADYLGNYALTHQLEADGDGDQDMQGDECEEAVKIDAGEPTCYRTTTALRLLCMPLRKWKRGLSHGFDDRDAYQDQVNALLRQALQKYSDMAEQKLGQIALIDDETAWAAQKAVLTTRWKQIFSQLRTAIKSLD